MAEKRYAVVRDGAVINIAVWDGVSEWTPPEGDTAIECPDEVGIGWTRADDEWVAPEIIEE